MKPNTKRSGLTLIELLVVISLILLLSTLALFISPRIQEDQRAVRSADHLSSWLLITKQRAYRDQQIRGVRLVRDVDNPSIVREMVYIERPEDYVPPPGTSLFVPSPIPPISPFNNTAFLAFKDLTNQSDPLNPIVQAGDYLVFNVLEVVPYNSHRVFSVTFIPPGNGALPPGMWGTHIVLSDASGTRPSVINSGAPLGAISTGIGFDPSENSSQKGFRFVRRPRPMSGEPALQLAKDMIIDLDQSIFGHTILPGLAIPGADDQLDILFSPRGQLVGSNGLGGKIILRLRNGTRPQDEGDQLFVVVYTRSGLIAAHPMNLDTTGDAYLFLKDGNTSGL